MEPKSLSPVAPLLLRLFKRPRETEILLEALSAHRPHPIFVWVDAPRNQQEALLVEEVLALVERKITWCIPTVRINDKNRGMTLAMRAAVDWFFESVDEGIILEDDCLPGEDFLDFATELLARYRDDRRVAAITGDNAAGGRVIGRSSYAFVPDFSVWGWATWKRVWREYDHHLSEWPRVRSQQNRLRSYWPNRVQREQWITKFDRIHADREGLQESTWRFMYLAFSLDALIILPRMNLIRNIGTDPVLATAGHRSALRANAMTFRIFPLRHPRSVKLFRLANWTLFFSPKRNNRQATWWYPLKKRTRKFVRGGLRKIRRIGSV